MKKKFLAVGVALVIMVFFSVSISLAALKTKDVKKGTGKTWDAGSGDEAAAHLEKMMPEEVFNEMFPHRNYYYGMMHAYSAYRDVTVNLDEGTVTPTPGKNIDYDIVRYDALIEEAKNFPEFCNSGSEENDKRELAAFLGNVSQETTVGWGSFDEDSERYTYGLGLTIEDGNVHKESHWHEERQSLSSGQGKILSGKRRAAIKLQ